MEGKRVCLSLLHMGGERGSNCRLAREERNALLFYFVAAGADGVWARAHRYAWHFLALSLLLLLIISFYLLARDSPQGGNKY